MFINHHTLAVISISGSCLDLLGALYLAYDLLGGEHGPLRTLTRGVTYGTIFAIGYGIPLGPVFAMTIGLTHGITLAWEFSAASKGQRCPGFWHDTAASAIRGVGYAVGGGWYFGPMFGLLYGAISTVSQVVAYQVGIRPTMNYAPAPHLRMSRLQALSTFNRTFGYGVAAWACALFVHRHDQAVSFGIRLGLTVGIVTFLLIAVTPVIEWAADRIPQRRMGVFGVLLMLAGFTFQSLQYWLALLDVPLR
jgi:hypothetical protein